LPQIGLDLGTMAHCEKLGEKNHRGGQTSKGFRRGNLLGGRGHLGWGKTEGKWGKHGRARKDFQT